MNTSAAIVDSPLRQANMRLRRQVGGRARRSVGQQTVSSLPPFLAAPRARRAVTWYPTVKSRSLSNLSSHLQNIGTINPRIGKSTIHIGNHSSLIPTGRLVLHGLVVCMNRMDS